MMNPFRLALMIRSALTALAAACVLLAPLPARAQATGITFSLPHSYLTSAAVYDSSGHLVRHLWKKQTSPQGTNTASWDGKSDAGTALTGSYTIKVLYHNMSYAWEGVIGNTSSSFTGPNRWELDVPLNDFAATPDGATVCTANGYSEGKPSADRFASSDPQTPTPVVYDYGSNGHANSALLLQHVATDGRRAYYANTGTGWDASTWTTFVFATNLSDNAETAFQYGQSFKDDIFEHTYQSVIDKTPADASGQPVAPPTGLAVQQDPGTLLAVAHGAANQIRLFNKTSGQPGSILSITAPGRIAFAPGGDLWAISGNSLVRFSGVGGANSVAATITDTSNAPLAVAVNPANADQVLVAWGGSSQQVKCYNRGGALQWTLGQAGGYLANGPAITTDKFDFFVQQNTGNIGPSAALTILPDGSFWVGDPGDERNLHFSGSRAYLGQIAYIPLQHKVVVDPNNPARAFDETGIEFRQDFSKPLTAGDPDPAAGGNGCWVRVNNWGRSARALSAYTDFTSVVTLSNGRTYGILGRAPWPAYPANPWDVVELTSAGLRETGIALDPIYRPDNNGNSGYLYPNGDLRYRTHYGTATDPYYVQRLTGFDSTGNPVWGSATQFASAPTAGPNPTGSSTYPLTSSNILLVYEPGTGSNNHLGGVASAGTSFAWTDEAAFSNNNRSQIYGSDPLLDTPPDGLGGYGTNAFGGLCGTSAFAVGQSAFTYYNGQGNSIDNQWDQFQEDGLFVGQWGESTYNHPHNSLDGIPGLAYNSTGPAVARINGVVYAFSADEGQHGGFHRWRLDGQVRELSATASVGGSANLGTAGAWPSKNLLLNPGFEAETSTSALSATNSSSPRPLAVPAGWREIDGTNGAGSFYTETYGSDAPSFPYHASHYSASAYDVYSYQDVSNIPNGTYTLTARVKSIGGQPACYLEAKDMTTGAVSRVNIPASSVWTTVQIPNYTVSHNSVRVAFYSHANAYQYLFFDDVTLAPSRASAPFLRADFVIPTSGAATLEAEDYDLGGEGIGFHDTDAVNSGGAFRAEGVDIEASATASGGLDVGYTTAGEWLKYSVTVRRSGSYAVAFRVASPTGGGTFHLEDESGAFLTGSLPVPSTGDWQIYTTVTANVPLAAGPHTLRVAEDTGGYNLDALSFTALGLTGDYFANQTLTGVPALTRADGPVNFNWGTAAPSAGLPADHFSARWSGQVVAGAAGSYTFATTSDEGVRLWVNGQKVIDNWTAHGSTTNTAAPISLTAGQAVDVRMDYYESTAGAVAKLLWSPPGGTQQPVPLTQLRPAF